MDAVGMPRRGDELDAEAGEIKKRGIQDIGVGLAGITAPCRYLAELQGTAKEFFEMFFGMFSQGGQVTRSEEIIAAGGAHLEILTEGDKSAPGQGLTQAAEDTTAQIDLAGFHINGVLGAGVSAAFYQGCITFRIDSGQAAKSLVEIDLLFRIFGGPAPLFYSVFYNL